VVESVRILSSSLLDNRSDVLENALWREGYSPTTGSDRGETFIISRELIKRDAASHWLGRLLGLGLLRYDFLLFHELILVFSVRGNVFFIVLVVLADALSDSVEAAGIDSVHLLGRNLLLLDGLDGDSLEIGDGLDVEFGHLSIVLLE
jgi:hypothetical protein